MTETASRPSTEPLLDELRRRLGEIVDLRKTNMLLFWDQRVTMPTGGSEARAEVAATVGKLVHELVVADEIGELLEELRPLEHELDYDSDDASLLRVTRRDYEKARRVPPSLTAEMRRASALALAAWGPAREQSDFAALLPHLERNLELKQQYVACFPTPEETYDVLLDDYEEGMKTAEVRAIFERLKAEQAKLVERDDDVDDSFLHRDFPADRQREVALAAVRAFGFDEQEWRLDQTAHPFASSVGPGDVRLTTNFRPDDLTALFATMHECGHVVYEHGVARELGRTPIGSGTSLGVHESQSRMWENLVGRSRPFWRHFYPTLQRAFPEQLGGVDEDTFYRAINKVQPSLIRIDADEVTYNLHIIVRFELEQELIDGALALADVPDAWNARIADYIGVEVPDARRGVLQDMHWAAGLIGYFPTYALGNVISGQIWERVREDLPDLDEQMERGEFAPLREWLRERLYRHGRKFTPQETVERVTGNLIDPGPYLRYLREKLAPQPA